MGHADCTLANRAEDYINSTMMTMADAISHFYMTYTA